MDICKITFVNTVLICTISCLDIDGDKGGIDETTHYKNNLELQKHNDEKDYTESYESIDYSYIKIGEQTWMTKNLNVSHFRNGDLIPEAKTKEEWINAGIQGQPAWCYYDNNEDNAEEYGTLYNWYAVNDSRGLAPEGWEIPLKEDWEKLIKYLRGIEGFKLKSEYGWDYNGNGNNNSGFTALPAGRRVLGNFESIGDLTNFWSASVAEKINNTKMAWTLNLHSGVDISILGDWRKEDGFSVRCIRYD